MTTTATTAVEVVGLTADRFSFLVIAASIIVCLLAVLVVIGFAR